MFEKSAFAGKDDIKIINLTPDILADYGVCGYKDAGKHLELRRKVEWYGEYYPKGLRIKALISQNGGYQGMIEYVPGKYAHRPVNADGYLFIHCIFVGFKKEFKGQGHATTLIKECVEEARARKMAGVAVVARKGSFMAKPDIFIKNGFESVDRAKPDFVLLALKFKKDTVSPSFRNNSTDKYQKGLTILRSAQCPYSVKNVNAIMATARNMKIPVNLVEIKDASSAQQMPCAFGTFCIIKDGQVLSHHPISNTRFKNLLKSVKQPF